MTTHHEVPPHETALKTTIRVATPVKEEARTLWGDDVQGPIGACTALSNVTDGVPESSLRLAVAGTRTQLTVPQAEAVVLALVEHLRSRADLEAGEGIAEPMSVDDLIATLSTFAGHGGYLIERRRDES
ncbi:hypothetical protein ACFWHR_04015 [Leucobacter sp. NPDC058333]|uniref:hypothetical protein n=1 Tax=Leucobacter sp. NPDC058333 TaxID=3346450 RepID=UPI00364726D0